MPRTGRPTTNPKQLRLGIRIDQDTLDMLDYCAKAKKISRSDVVREGIKVVYEEQKEIEQALD